MTKADFVKLDQLSSLNAKVWLNRKFSTALLTELPGTPPLCAEEQMQEVLGISMVGNKGACFYDYSYENSLTMYEIKNYTPIYLYECESECFEDLMWNCRKSLKKKKEGHTETYNYTSYTLGSKTLEFRTYDSDELNNIVLLYSKSTLQKVQQESVKFRLLQQQQAVEASKLQAALDREADSLVILANQLLLNTNYEDAQQTFRKAYLIKPSEELWELIRRCDEMRCSVFVNEGDSLLVQKKYRDAIRIYQKALDCGADSYKMSEKISKAEKQELTDSIIRLEAAANSLFLAREYQQARLLYNQILSMDSWRYETKKRISEIDVMLQFLEERKYKIYDYATLNPLNYNSALSFVENGLNQYIGTKSSGDMLLTMDFNFDTLGINLSRYELDGIKVGAFEERFAEITNSFQLTPSLKNGYFVNAATQRSFHVSWQTDKATYRYTTSGIHHRRGFKSDYTSISAFLKKNYTYGTYTIESKAITVNQEDIRSLKVSAYKANAGPFNVLYSMILPGLGTKRVTYGAQGTGRMVTFLVSGGLAFGAYYLSGELNEKFQNSPPGSGQKYQKQAQMSEYAAYGLAGISASIYVYDFIHVLSRGFKNSAKNKRMNQQIMEYSPIKSANLKLK